MIRFDDAIATFEHAIERSRQMIALYEALTALRPREPANDDALRSAYFQAVSSFDFFVHELAAIEAKHRFRNSLRTRNISLPMEIMTIANLDLKIGAAETRIRQGNSYKAFVDPKRLAELLSCYCENPWERICDKINQGALKADQRLANDIKGQLKNVWKRRNKIAHEADVNPTLAGISLWPIDKQDTEITISFIQSIGSHLPHVISQPLPEGEGEADIDD